MEAGVVKEFDEVPRLMGRRGSTFRGMVVEAGLEGAAGGAMSRAASLARLAQAADAAEDAAAEGAAATASPAEPGAASPAAGLRPPRPGQHTFVRRLANEYDLK